MNYTMHGEYFCFPISLIIGNYYLTEFAVLDKNNNIIYISPKRNSDKAYLVDSPLPISFSIAQNEVKKVYPEAIAVNNSSLSDFGYAIFLLNIVETVDILISAFEYDTVSRNFIPINAQLSVTDNNSAELFSGEIESGVNTISLAADFNSCKISVQKSGFFPFDTLISFNSLLLHEQSTGIRLKIFTTCENPFFVGVVGLSDQFSNFLR